jgi:TrmH family RNA methyltransferase
MVRSVLVGRKATREFRELLGRVPREAEVAQVTERLFEQIAQTQAPQGIAALVELRAQDLDGLLARRDAFFLIGCGLQDPGNIGVMMRSGQALGATALFTLPETVSPFNPKAARASAGAIFRLPIFPGQEPGALFRRLRAAGVRIIAADQHSPSPLWQSDLTASVAVMIGREGTGLPPELFKEAGQLVSIPIHPGTESINAATAASIFLYEAARQRGFRY